MYEITLEGKVRLRNISGGQYPLFETLFESEANMPEDLRTKLSILKLAQDYEEIEGVGQKVSSTVFWIYDQTDAIYAMISMVGVHNAKMYVEYITNMHTATNTYRGLLWGCVLGAIVLIGTSVAILTGVI